MRTTGVRLVAETRQYKRDMDSAAKSTRGFKEEVDGAKASGDKLGEGMDKVGKSSGSAFEEMRRTAADLDKQIATTRRGLAALGSAYANSGSPDVLKQIRQQQGMLRELKSVRSLLPDPGELAKAGAGMGSSILGGIRGSLTSVSPAALGVAGLGVLVAPVLGAAVAGGIIGGVGIGGVLGGVALASKDPAVKEAGKSLGDTLMGGLQADAGVFTEPMLAAVDKIERRFQGLRPRLRSIFANSSDFLDPLLDGALNGIEGIMAGVERTVMEGGPVIDAFADGFDEIGRSVGEAMATISGGSADAGDAIRMVMGVIGESIVITGRAVRVLTEMYGAMSSVQGSITKVLPFLDVLGLKEDAAAAAADRHRLALDRASTAKRVAALTSGGLAAAEDDVKEAQERANVAQKELTASIDMMAPALQRSTMLADNMKRATTQLYGAQEAGIDANESYQASWDALSESVKKNKGSLDAHTAAGRANRDSLQALLSSSREMYFADLRAGVAVDEARKKHEKRTGRIKEEARQLGLNRTETGKLISTYGRIPGKKQTALVLSGVDRVADMLGDLYLLQRSLATGKPVSQVAREIAREKGMPAGFAGPVKGPNGRYYAEGGWTGPGHKHQPAGVVHADEFVIKKASRAKIERMSPGLLDEMNATGQVPGYARGGLVAPVDTSGRWPYVTNVAGTRIPSRAEVSAKVTPAFNGGGWPSSPSAVRGDSGRWRYIKRYLDAANLGGSFGNGYRPGDPKWHGSGWAVDWMGYNLDALASRLARLKPLALIHRTNRRDYAYTRGRNKGSFNNPLMEAHRNHIHIAMANGGMIREPVLGVGASGRTYSFGENYRPERVVPMGGGGASAGGGQITIVLQNQGVIGSRMELDNWLVGAVDRMRSRARI